MANNGDVDHVRRTRTARAVSLLLTLGVAAFGIIPFCYLFSEPGARIYAFPAVAQVYSSEATAGLASLDKVRPEVAAYLVQRHVPIEVLSHDDYVKRTSLRMAPGCTAEYDGHVVIVLDGSVYSDPKLLAVALTHEAVHVRYGDPSQPEHRLNRKGQIHEEAQAHLIADKLFLQMKIHGHGFWFAWLNPVVVALEFIGIKYQVQWILAAIFAEIVLARWCWHQQKLSPASPWKLLAFDLWTGVVCAISFQVLACLGRAFQLT